MISYDTNVLIYALQSNKEFTAHAQTIVTNGEQQGAVLSVIIKHEILTGMAIFGHNDGLIKEALDSLMSAKWVDVNDKVVGLAVDLTKQCGRKLKGNDALVVATAILGGADVFYTNDKQLVGLNLPQIKIKSLLKEQ